MCQGEFRVIPADPIDLELSIEDRSWARASSFAPLVPSPSKPHLGDELQGCCLLALVLALVVVWSWWCSRCWWWSSS